ncbi:ABC transporter ATP-binding protein [Caminibacter mediatlanticus]|uniref:Ferric enterobactin transport ATP-binding protein n=1 Tax=Caminibacter mediatlanticus TB-2 TaxID=391592 RepID=A0AAI9F2R4_9BACT|nr:ABC transporter ATP-binding protein [Caminibacter mediatlanticus]EDM24078.1 ferric enterobactin transport ATP-binding protein [Caminibacter mediatlanticus TB-2]
MYLVIDNIKVNLKSKEILNNVTFKVKRGEVVGILGKNGVGKSTLLKYIAKLLPNKGKVYLSNKDLHKISNKELAKKLSYVSQTQNGGFLSVYETLLLGRKPYFSFSPSKEDIKKVEQIIEKLNLKDIQNKKTNELSGGELQKVMIAKELVKQSEILLFDEPTNNLDIKNQIEILDYIKETTKKNNLITLIIIHDINLSLKYCDKFMMIKDKKIIYEGDESIITPSTLKEIYEIDAKICIYKERKVVIY